MTTKSQPDPHATEAFQSAAIRTEVLRPVRRTTESSNADIAGACDATEKLEVVTPTTEKLTPVVPLIPAQRQDSRSTPTSIYEPTPVQVSRPRPRWEHFPTERHPSPPEQATPKQRVSGQPGVTEQQRWQRSAVAPAPARGTLAAAGFAACDYLIRTVSILGLLAVVGMVTAGTAQTHAQERTPGTTVASSPAHQNGFTSTPHR